MSVLHSPCGLLSAVIPNLPDEGGQERDLTSACVNDAVWPQRIRAQEPVDVLITSVVIHSRRKVPHPRAFSVRVRDDTHFADRAAQCDR